MKVYIVEWFSAEPYSDCSGVEKVFFNKEDAQKFIDDNCGQVLRGDPDDNDDGVMISSIIYEFTVE